MKTKSVLPPEVNLVRYDKPELVVNKSKPVSAKSENAPSKPKVCSWDLGDDADEEVNSATVLGCILPPREWEENGKFWRQKISNQPATKMDVKKLADDLDMYLKQYQAREVGICPVRRELYSQCFNEIIRQVTMNCAERGLMLINIRDEINMTIDAYQELYESSIAFGIRKALLSEHKKAELEKKIEKLRAENKELEEELAETIATTEKVERESAEARAIEVQRQAEELNALKKANQLIKVQLESIIAPKRHN
ncbi:axonemal dynein light intermediate polypeptide 1-like [Adelges cooleyi]|uniref:axonemal dynein light intermediate polypeptide 1-like n=1 Tax=Adelges cooleyi TaxID=133065 RepID=UPI00217F7646|nr:axonemal dynein light intermediate polypeptide 1-like [Adelges cooleyi]